MSEECVKSELDLFTIPMTQMAIENTYVEVPPISAISDTAPLEFFIAGNGVKARAQNQMQTTNESSMKSSLIEVRQSRIKTRPNENVIGWLEQRPVLVVSGRDQRSDVQMLRSLLGTRSRPGIRQNQRRLFNAESRKPV